MDANTPAFPGNGEFFTTGPQGTMAQSAWGMEGAKGLTKRELIAAMAMQGLLSAGTPAVIAAGKDVTSDVQMRGILAAYAVGHADALIAELSKEKP